MKKPMECLRRRWPAIVGATALAFATFSAWAAPPASAPPASVPEEQRFANDQMVVEARVLPEDPFHPIYQVDNKKQTFQVRRGEVIRVVVDGTPLGGFHTYPVAAKGPEQGSYRTVFRVGKVDGLLPLYPVVESQPELVKQIYEYSQPFFWSTDVAILPNARPGRMLIPVEIHTQTCSDGGPGQPAICIPFNANLQIPIEISSEEPILPGPTLENRIIVARQLGMKKDTVSPQPTEKPGTVSVGKLLTGTTEEYKETILERLAKSFTFRTSKIGEESSDLLRFILAGIFWGAVSLVTPCVFPMIPITVSFFLKQSEKEHHRPIQMALIYSATIVVVLTVAAAFLLSFFRFLSINPLMNYGLGALFIFFSLSLFGMYDIELPSSFAQFTSAKEGQGGVVGTIFMALTFTIISFACVAPFLGGFGGTAAGSQRPFWHNILGGLAFSATFASPFFFLALFPSLLRKMPKSGSWLNSVKVVMGFLELAAAFVFFRTAEIYLTSGEATFFTFDLVLGVYVTLCFLCGLYLLGVYRLPHDTPEEHLGVIRMLFAGFFICFGIYFMPALFKIGDHAESQRPTGTIYAWVDAFLLPEARRGKELPNTANLESAIAQALLPENLQETGLPQRIFLDFTGVTCKNCNLNENDVFPRPKIQRLLKDYLIVKLYTDTVPEQYYDPRIKVSEARQRADAEVNLEFQKKVFGTEQLPLYAILQPRTKDEIDIIAIYSGGRITNVSEFALMLSDPK